MFSIVKGPYPILVGDWWIEELLKAKKNHPKTTTTKKHLMP